MMKKEFYMKVATLVLLAAASSAFSQATQQQRAASVLLTEFETIGSTKSDFLLDSESRMHTHFIPSENSLRWPFMGWLGALRDLGPDTAAKVEPLYGTVTVGAKYFHLPRRPDGKGVSIGMFTSDATYIAISNGGAANLAPCFEKASTVAVRGRPAWTWTADPYEGHPDKTTYYAQQTGPYLVLSNSRSDFEAVLTDLASDKQLQPPPDWETMNAHPYWLYRDMNSKGNNQLDLGMIVSISITTDLADGPKGGDFTVRVVDGDITMQRKPQFVPKADQDKFVAAGPPGVWEATLPLTLEESNNTLVSLIYWVGFGALY
jgi:hypothetical protein